MCHGLETFHGDPDRGHVREDVRLLHGDAGHADAGVVQAGEGDALGEGLGEEGMAGEGDGTGALRGVAVIHDAGEAVGADPGGDGVVLHQQFDADDDALGRALRRVDAEAGMDGEAANEDAAEAFGGARGEGGGHADRVILRDRRRVKGTIAGAGRRRGRGPVP
uniref:Uncharacterized protein n=1 Tax=Nostoc flagelliforme str. Sunitezuoqi TaxID=676037 RepID=E7DQI0_9NOSO|nr:hypothetical protein Nfla_10402 [Nostoc flagelliforme str. Sunitezuoqi]